MKKTMILAATFLFYLGASAQVHFGLKAGLNASDLSRNDEVYDTKISFHAGALAHIHTASKSWAIQPELLYSVEGDKQTVSGKTSRLNLGYLNIPVLVQYLFDNGFRIEAGPQIGFLMSAKTRIEDADESLDVKDGFKSIAFSIPVGVGYLTSTGLGFDARYNFGVSDLSESDSDLSGNTFQFGVFWQFSDSKIKE